MSEISIVTLNTWKGEGDYPRRLTAMTGLLSGLAPDIVLLQEVFAVPEAGRNTAETLAGALGMNMAWHPARAKIRRFGGADVASQSGLAVLARAEILSSVAVPLPQDAADGERIAQIARIAPISPREGAGTAGEIAVLNLHLTHLRDAHTLRRQQFAAAVAGLPADRTCIIGGDFNTWVDPRWLESVRRVLPAGLIANTRFAVPGHENLPTLVDLPGEDGCIDHLLVLTPAGHTAAPVTAFGHHGGADCSDHLAVRAVLGLRQ